VRALALAVTLVGPLAGPVSAQTAEEIIETARKVYTVDEPEPDPCPTATSNEIVVCRPLDQPDDPRLTSPTERAYESGETPPDPVPRAPYVLGLPQCGVEVTCHRIGRAPPPIYIIDLSKIPEPLSPEEAALVFRAEDPPSPEAASPAAAP
jgi:hypothetical protein